MSTDRVVRHAFRALAWTLCAAVLCAPVAGKAAGGFTYPPTKRGPVVDTYGSVSVPDPYRWLEDDAAPDVARWCDAENAFTRSYLDPLPGRKALATRLRELYNYPRISAPVACGSRLFTSRNTGLQNQSVYYVQDDPTGEPRVLLDPNTLSADGTTAPTATAPSIDGALFAYALSEKGSDREIVRVRDVASGLDRADTLRWVKFTNLSWVTGNSGFYYTRFPRPGTVPPGDENYYGAVYYHALGTPQSRDPRVFDTPDRKEAFNGGGTSYDGRFLFVQTYIGSSDNDEVRVLDRAAPGAALEPLFTGFTAIYNPIDAVDGTVYFVTSDNAPLRRVIAVDWAKGSRTPRGVVPQTKDLLLEARIVGGRLVLHYLHNASAQLVTCDLAGGNAQDIVLPGIGSIDELHGEPDDPSLFLLLNSYIQPATAYRCEIATGRVEPFGDAMRSDVSGVYETKQLWYPSMDGTQISMFVTMKKGLAHDGARPTMISGYGGFNVPNTPGYRAMAMLWVERGGIWCETNLRGGSEYGEDWHTAGMLAKKQNVFDDFIAAAEYMIAQGWTKPKKIAIEGGSNGGLLVGACLVQRPDLYGAALCRVPVADMLRYDKLTVGKFWVSEYGTADDPAQFPFLFRYSPLHNVRDGVSYPATLVTTADHDDRVGPGLAKKFAARLQAATAGPAPIMIRVEKSAGHGGGKPIAKRIAEDTDLLSFVYWQLGELPAARAASSRRTAPSRR